MRRAFQRRLPLHVLFAGRRSGREFPGIDIELTGNCTAWESVQSIQLELCVFVERVEAESGRLPLLYTTEDVARELIPPRCLPIRANHLVVGSEPSLPCLVSTPPPLRRD